MLPAQPVALVAPEQNTCVGFGGEMICIMAEHLCAALEATVGDAQPPCLLLLGEPHRVHGAGSLRQSRALSQTRPLGQPTPRVREGTLEPRNRADGIGRHRQPTEHLFRAIHTFHFALLASACRCLVRPRPPPRCHQRHAARDAPQLLRRFAP